MKIIFEVVSLVCILQCTEIYTFSISDEDALYQAWSSGSVSSGQSALDALDLEEGERTCNLLRNTILNTKEDYEKSSSQFISEKTDVVFVPRGKGEQGTLKLQTVACKVDIFGDEHDVIESSKTWLITLLGDPCNTVCKVEPVIIDDANEDEQSVPTKVQLGECYKLGLLKRMWGSIKQNIHDRFVARQEQDAEKELEFI